ncbi:MAG: hypothetical protein HYW78_01170 [Parcubacteria group bacterium]|nr:hypothetical protein [Parcubacteria group bacterium]
MGKKFRVGEKVRISENPSLPYEHPKFASEMFQWEGKQVTIFKSLSCGTRCGDGCYRIEEDNNQYVWSARWFRKIKDESIELRNETATVLIKDTLDDNEQTVDRIVSLKDFVERIVECNAQSIETPLLITGARYYIKKGAVEIVIVEQTPQIRTIIVPESMYGNKKYTLAFPYVIYIFCIENGFMPAYRSRVFYRNAPLTSLDDQLLLCNLTHVNIGEDNYATGEACMKANIKQSDSLEEKVRAQIRYFWESSFIVPKQAEEQHGSFIEGFTQSGNLDERIKTLEAWEKASKKDPLFVFEIPWIEIGLTPHTVQDEMFKKTGIVIRSTIENTNELIDIMYQCKETQ